MLCLKNYVQKSCLQNVRSAFLVRQLVKCLGHIAEAGSLCADPDKVEAIRTWPKPDHG